MIRAIAAMMTLGACAYNSPFGTGFEGHMVDMPIKPPAVIYVLRADQAQWACGETTKAINGLRTEAMGCATKMPDDHTFRYVLICPPSWTVCVHEAGHTSEGNFH